MSQTRNVRGCQDGIPGCLQNEIASQSPRLLIDVAIGIEGRFKMVLGAQFEESGERRGNLNDGCGVETGIAVQVGKNLVPVKGLHEKALGIQIKASEREIVQVVGLGDGCKAFWSIGSTFRSRTRMGFLCLDGPEDQEHQAGGKQE